MFCFDITFPFHWLVAGLYCTLEYLISTRYCLYEGNFTSVYIKEILLYVMPNIAKDGGFDWYL